MSYFPTPDPERLRIALEEYQSFAQASPFTQDQQGDWVINSTTAEGTAPVRHAITWPLEEPQPAGLLGMPDMNHPVFSQSMDGNLSNKVALAWPPELPAQQPTESLNHSTNRTWATIHDTSQAQQPPRMWHTSQPESVSSAMVQDASPSLSAYSLSSQRSSMSSPYQRSDPYIHAARSSPMIKLEEPLDHFNPRMLLAPEHIPLDQSTLVNPGDLVTHAQPSYDDRRTYSVSPSFIATTDMDDGDVKPQSKSNRPTHERSYSSDYAGSETTNFQQKRRVSKAENASCACDHCGKQFQRNYNLKAHLETHDPHRSHPHFCPYPECDKRFVRRTDLLRHEQSVHLKTRAHRCPLCSSTFARKDTLRRHVDDGCPKRTEVRKRVSKSSHSWSAASSRQPSYQNLHTVMQQMQ